MREQQSKRRLSSRKLSFTASGMFQKQISNKVVSSLLDFDYDAVRWIGMDSRSARKIFFKNIPNPEYSDIWDEWDPSNVDNVYIDAVSSGDQLSMEIHDIGPFEWVRPVYKEDKKRGVWNLRNVKYGERSMREKQVRRQSLLREAREPRDAEVVLDGTSGGYSDGEFFEAMLHFCDMTKVRVPKRLRMEIDDLIENPKRQDFDLVSEIADDLSETFKTGAFGWHPDESGLLMWAPYDWWEDEDEDYF